MKIYFTEYRYVCCKFFRFEQIKISEETQIIQRKRHIESIFFKFFSLIVDFTTTAAMSFQIGLNNTQLQNYTIWKWSSGANFTNDLSIPFGLNNFDGNMRNCPVGHCGVFKVKNDTAFVFDNCCSQVSSRYICSRYVDTQEKTNDVHIIID